jgi:ribonucleoside-diphosphate reductase alpha chain
MFDIAHMERGNRVQIDRTRDAYLSALGKALMEERFLLPEESFQDLFARLAMYYGDDNAHAQRLYDYMSNLWFMPDTPILRNGGTSRGLPMSCFLNETRDCLEDIMALWNENVHLASLGGGVGSYWGHVRSIGETVGRGGKTGGIVPFIRVMDSMTVAISQDAVTRSNAAIYLPIWHPEIEEFIEIGNAEGGDPNRKVLNLHHGVVISNRFMQAVERDDEWLLKSPKDNHVVARMSARALWIRLLEARIETSAPSILFEDHVNDAMPAHHKMAGLRVKMSNLGSEITLPTGRDHLGQDRTSVCCLSSLNLDKFEEWQAHPYFIEDVMRFLDNILSDFIDKAPSSMKRATYAAMRERSVGLGVMGFHSFLQQKMIAPESAMAKVWNRRMFQHIKRHADDASGTLAQERGACPDAADYGFRARFSNKIAIAQSETIAIICGGASQGIEPYAANAQTHKTLSGSYSVRNKALEALLESKNHNRDDVWSSIFAHGGAVQHLDCLSPAEKDVFKTAYEIDQKWLIEHAGDRAPYVCQSQSLKLFLPAAIHKRDLHQLHWEAWKKGVKSLYYCHAQPAASSPQDHMNNHMNDQMSANQNQRAATPQGFRDPELGDERSPAPPFGVDAKKSAEEEHTDFGQSLPCESAQILTTGAWEDAFLDDLFSR